MINTLKGLDILRGDQLSVEQVELICDTAARLELIMRDGGRLSVLKDRVLATLFYEPSTRTRLSFETAMLHLGGHVISVADAKTSSSAAKGESLWDTGKMVEAYADVVVIRHPVVGSAQELAAGCGVPVINGGDGSGQHPTQALLDAYTIRKEKGRFEGLTAGMVGDLKNGRTVHSLSALLTTLGVRLFYFVAPPELPMPPDLTASLRARGATIIETPDLAEAAAHCDVLYMTRVQRERFTDPAEYERVRHAYVLTLPIVESGKPGMMVMHPLPRVDEIATEVDACPGAAYFRQAANGVPVRMALIALVTGAELQFPEVSEAEWATLRPQASCV
ncbi:MAG: aspartate carbamoyltransferase [Vicinamibacterales bacterium]